VRGETSAAVCHYRDELRRMLKEALAATSPEQERNADRLAAACLWALADLSDDLFANRSNAENAEALQTAQGAVATVAGPR
jgi:hypothetical protein